MQWDKAAPDRYSAADSHLCQVESAKEGHKAPRVKLFHPRHGFVHKDLPCDPVMCERGRNWPLKGVYKPYIYRVYKPQMIINPHRGVVRYILATLHASPIIPHFPTYPSSESWKRRLPAWQPLSCWPGPTSQACPDASAARERPPQTTDNHGRENINITLE